MRGGVAPVGVILSTLRALNYLSSRSVTFVLFLRAHDSNRNVGLRVPDMPIWACIRVQKSRAAVRLRVPGSYFLVLFLAFLRARTSRSARYFVFRTGHFGVFLERIARRFGDSGFVCFRTCRAESFFWLREKRAVLRGVTWRCKPGQVGELLTVPRCSAVHGCLGHNTGRPMRARGADRRLLGMLQAVHAVRSGGVHRGVCLGLSGDVWGSW